MRLVVDINHPADYHYYKNFIRRMMDKGHEVLITATKKDVSFDLLERSGLEFVSLGSYGNTLAQKVLNLPLIDYRMYKAVQKFDPDIFLGLGSIRAPHVSFALGKRA